MAHSYNGGPRQPRARAKRLACAFARDTAATELLRGCPVVTALGERIGHVKAILVDVRTRQLRYAMLSCGNGPTSVAIPWHALYFDSALIRLVYYTYS